MGVRRERTLEPSDTCAATHVLDNNIFPRGVFIADEYSCCSFRPNTHALNGGAGDDVLQNTCSGTGVRTFGGHPVASTRMVVPMMSTIPASRHRLNSSSSARHPSRNVNAGMVWDSARDVMTLNVAMA